MARTSARPAHTSTLDPRVFSEKLKGNSRNDMEATTVETIIPISINYNPDQAFCYERIINSIIVNSVVLHFEQLVDLRTTNVLEYHLNEYGTSFSRLCEEPEKVSYALHDIFGESADVVINEIITAAYKAFGFKSMHNGKREHANLTNVLKTLKKRVLEGK